MGIKTHVCAGLRPGRDKQSNRSETHATGQNIGTIKEGFFLANGVRRRLSRAGAETNITVVLRTKDDPTATTVRFLARLKVKLVNAERRRLSRGRNKSRKRAHPSLVVVERPSCRSNSWSQKSPTIADLDLPPAFDWGAATGR